MMGGKKKSTISQALKAQSKEAQTKEAKATTKVEKKVAGVIPPNPREEKVIREIQKMRVLTPYSVASHFNIRLSVAKDFLEELHKQGVIAYVSSGRHIKIYKPI